MPLTINVGLSKKVGMPDYGSLGASCNVQFEVDHSVLERDLDSFHQRVKDAFTACRQAVNDELALEKQPSNGNGHASPNGNGNGRLNGNGNGNGQRRSNARKATASQVRALRAIADRLGLNLASELQPRFGVDEPEELSITEASQTIDELKAKPSANGNGARR
jgi:hypothetical protein